jgi:hypothetical protein
MLEKLNTLTPDQVAFVVFASGFIFAVVVAAVVFIYMEATKTY